MPSASATAWKLGFDGACLISRIRNAVELMMSGPAGRVLVASIVFDAEQIVSGNYYRGVRGERRSSSRKVELVLETISRVSTCQTHQTVIAAAEDLRS